MVTSLPQSTTSSQDHLAVLCRVMLRRGWCKPTELEAARQALAPEAGVNSLLDLLVARQAILRNQARELRLTESDLESVANWQVLSRLGSGAMGTVYLASDANGTAVALKVISAKHLDDQEFRTRFSRETELATSLEHPHIARALGVGEVNGQPWLAMEYVDGPSLSDLLRSHGPLPEGWLLRIMLQVAEGLNYAYTSAGLIHRDIKPENILVHRQHGLVSDLPEDDDDARIIDFGLAKTTDSDQSLTMTGLTMGTPHYMAPEQICGKKDLDCRADIYGLGCTMFHLLTGNTPYQGDSPGGIMMAHVNHPLPDAGHFVPSLHERTRELLRTAMAKDREDRYLHFAALITALREALTLVTGSAPTGPRLLRKPLVIKRPTPVKREGSGTHRRSSGLHEAPSSVPGKDATSRIVAKHRERAHGEPAEDPGTGAIITSAIRSQGSESRTTARLASGLKAEAALRKVHTDSIKRHSNSVPAIHRRLESSAAFQASADTTGGIGVLPWVVICFAVLALGWVLFFAS